MTCEKHKKEIEGYDLKELANKIGDLHYEALAELLLLVSKKLYNDSTKDLKNKKEQLANQLLFASTEVHKSSIHIKTAWYISKPFMSKKEE